MKEKQTGFVVAIVILSTLLVASVIMGVTGFFCSFSVQEFETDLQVGQIENINVFANKTSVVSFTLDGAFLPGEKIPFTIQISAPEIEKNVVFRVKSRIFGANEIENILFETSENFSLEDDGYYYFNNTLIGGDKVTFCEKILLPKAKFVDAGKRYVLTIFVETLDAELNTNVIWKNNM